MIAKTKPVPVPVVAVQLPPAPIDNMAILNFVEKWRKSWSAKNLKTYIACYSPSFTHKKYLDLEGWKKHKSSLNKRYQFINVTTSDIVIKRGNKSAEVSFFQEYKSNLYSGNGNKTLQLVKKDGKWLIQKEIM